MIHHQVVSYGAEPSEQKLFVGILVPITRGTYPNLLGKIIDQRPVSGQQYGLVVLTGQLLADVRSSIQSYGLSVGNLWQEYSTVYSEGLVIEQNPKPGEEVEVGWPIDFVYSQGLPKQPVRVPDTPQAELPPQPAQDQWRSLRVQISVPEGPPQEVTILVIDDFGAREVYRETHPGGERVERIVQGRGDGAILQVYIGGRMFENRLFKE